MGLKKILIISVVIHCIIITVHGYDEDVMEKTLPAYAVSLAAEDANTSVCREELRIFRDAIDRRILWGIRVLDSSGKPKTGFTYGNNFWLGSRNQCYDTFNKKPLALANYILKNNTRFRNPDEEFSPFPTRYFVAYARHNSTLQYHLEIPTEDMVSLGLCLPASCSTDDISGILKRIFHNRTLLVGDLYSADFKLVEVKDLQDDHQWLLSWKIIFFGIFVIGLILLMIAGTIYDVTIHQKRLRMKKKYLVYENNNTSEIKCSSNNEESVFPKPNDPSRFGEVLMCFSIYTNTIKIFNTRLGEKSVPCIHGIKFIGMFWIIMAHGVYFINDYIDNRVWVWRVHEDMFSSLMSNATYSVDTFFFLSGFLIAYSFWNESLNKGDTKKPTKCSRNIQNFFLMVVKRYLRLTPTYMLFLGLYEVNALWYSKTTVFHTSSQQHEICAKYWWRNMLYINNFFSMDSMCMMWSWYLSADFQFFVLAAFLLTLSCMYLFTSVLIIGLLLVGSIISSGYISYSLDYILTLDEQHKRLDYLYEPPWMRLGPYAVGFILAYVLVKYRRNIDLNKKAVFIGWCLGCICNLAVIFGLWHTKITVMSTAFYMALSRTAWGLGVAWVIFACCTNNAGAVNRLLSFKGFIPLSRLTFCAYLINPFLIQSIYQFGESTTHMDVLSIGMMCFGLILGSYLSAYILCLMIEMPSALLLNVIMKRQTAKK